jgi:hypothetical protein
LEREVSARENLTQGEAEIAGLRAHATAVRWASTQIEELATRVESWRTAIAHDASDIASREALNSLQAEVGSLLERVDAAQLKADQRDYIVRSIREALVEMGYVVSDAVAEHPEHPASSLVFTAANAAGQGLSVSVPVEGEVWYDIRGFTLGTETRLDGKAIAVCDSAQDVIEEMHRMLGEQHEVQAGELLWEGKDPDRHLRAVKQLPQPKDDRHERGAS